ncbi:MAG: GWxTD domain-containing protein [Candidatus Aminicenantes bacterium]|nr:GWxTD domain-containing protein [Candidatus Aminicenantes bacterium]
MKFIFPLLLSLSLISTLPLFSQVKKSLKDLGETYRKWLEEEVVYIITPNEKEVFLQLETDREREIFLNAFWKQRDPTPGTPANEYKQEHYSRIKYANTWFGKESPGPGWRSDMGRIYIMLGLPQAIQKHENLPEVFPLIIWFYGGMIEYGLPNAFNVVFFKKYGMGDYELYSPVKYGPQHLLIHYKGDATSYIDAYSELFNVDPTIAEVSMTLIPGDSQSLSPSLASEILIWQKVPSAPYKKVEDSYAKKLLMYKDIVEVDYTANYIENDSLVKVIQDKSGIFFVHYLIEPRRLTFEQYLDRFLSNLEIIGKISDLNGRTIYQFERTVPIEFNEGQITNIKNKLFSFQGMFPLVTGQYRFNLLLKNSISKEFTSVESEITIPEASSLRISSLILANKLDINSKHKGKNKPFLIEGSQLVPSPRNDFSPQETLYLFLQIQGLTEDLRENAFLEYSIIRDDKKIHSLVKGIKEYPKQTNFFEEFPLANLPAAYYKIKASLLNKNQEEILSEQSRFYVTAVINLPRPWVLSLPIPPIEDPATAHILGNQFLNKKDLQKAKSLLEEAYNKNPNSQNYALSLSRVLFIAKEYQRIKQIALPFLKDQRKYAFLQIVGQSCQALGELNEAISHYKDYLSHFGTNIIILNSIGKCYYQLGNTKEALIAWEKSLELNPGQEELKTLVKSLKEKK